MVSPWGVGTAEVEKETESQRPELDEEEETKKTKGRSKKMGLEIKDSALVTDKESLWWA